MSILERFKRAYRVLYVAHLRSVTHLIWKIPSVTIRKEKENIYERHFKIRVKNEKGMKGRRKKEWKKEESAPTESTQEVYFLAEQTGSK